MSANEVDKPKDAAGTEPRVVNGRPVIPCPANLRGCRLLHLGPPAQPEPLQPVRASSGTRETALDRALRDLVKPAPPAGVAATFIAEPDDYCQRMGDCRLCPNPSNNCLCSHHAPSPAPADEEGLPFVASTDEFYRPCDAPAKGITFDPPLGSTCIFAIGHEGRHSWELEATPAPKGAPERIWLWWKYDGGKQWQIVSRHEGDIQYIRADIALSDCIDAESASLTPRVSEEAPKGDYALAKEDHAYAVGFQAGLILATNTEQSRIRWTTSGLLWNDYSEDYKQQVAAVERRRVESLKVIKGRADLTPRVSPPAFDDYIAYCRDVHHGQYEDSGADIITMELCDSDAPGAFKVYRDSRPSESAEITAGVISFTALRSVLERLRSKNTNPNREWYLGWNAALDCLINDIKAMPDFALYASPDDEAARIAEAREIVEPSMNDPRGTYTERLPINIATALAPHSPVTDPSRCLVTRSGTQCLKTKTTRPHKHEFVEPPVTTVDWEVQAREYVDAVALQRHRDAWRSYAYGKRDKPTDYLDGDPTQDRPQTRIEQLEAEVAVGRDAGLEEVLRIAEPNIREVQAITHEVITSTHDARLSRVGGLLDSIVAAIRSRLSESVPAEKESK